MAGTLSGVGSLSGAGNLSAPAPVYSLGDVGPGGGKIFYVAATPFAFGPTLSSTATYLESAPKTGANAWTDAKYAWSGNVNTAIGTTASAIGTGYKNTLAMVAQSATEGKAGTICRAYRGPNNLSDWFLPSKDELNQLWINRSRVDSFTTSTYDKVYFTSTEDTTYNSYEFVKRQDMTNGEQGIIGKDPGSYALAWVRPIRAF